MDKRVIFEDLGLIDYKKAWDYQEELFQETISRKIKLRDDKNAEPTENRLLFCEHPHVYTLGKSGAESHLLLNKSGLEDVHASYYQINRGGDITYHGPGQLVAYPIFDLDYFFTDIHKYLRYLEEAVIQTISEYGIKGGRVEGQTGVWIEGDTKNARKICALGVKCSRWVTMHGIGFNINPDLNYFNNIIPCGIQDKAVTSLQKEVSNEIDMNEVKKILRLKLAEQFDFTYIDKK
ncbi:MAG: lipoyl(octanoyl) transferase LipB [Crocinitomicaceae bacterium]